MMAFLRSQVSQCALNCLVALAAMNILQMFQPYRVQSDNVVSVCGQAAVFAWVFSLLLCLVGVVGEGTPAVLGGVALVIATLGLFVYALYLIYAETSKIVTDANDVPCTDDDPEIEATNDETTTATASTAEIDETRATAEIEIGVTVLSTLDSSVVTVQPSPWSPWALLGYNATEDNHTAGNLPE